jgi:hypothetical protein
LTGATSSEKGTGNVKNKNRPRREKQRKLPGTKRVKPFNPWIAKYFDLSGTGIERCKDEQLGERTMLQNKAHSNQVYNRDEQ